MRDDRDLKKRVWVPDPAQRRDAPTFGELLAFGPRVWGSEFLPADRPLLLWNGEDYQPWEQWSSSGLGECERYYFWRYIIGIREATFPWAFISKVPAPPKARKGDSASYDLVRTFNKRRGNALGKAAHDILERYYVGKVQREEWRTEPGKVALSGLSLLPHPRDCKDAWREYQIDGEAIFKATGLASEIEYLHFIGFVDLLARSHDLELLLGDYKTTSDRRWIKTPDDLLTDQQSNLYGVDAMVRCDVEFIEALWIYFLTKGSPFADGVPIRLIFDRAIQIVRGMYLRADALRTKMRSPEARNPKLWRANPEACPKFGGCCYAKERGGPCDFKPNPVDWWDQQESQRLVRISRKAPEKTTVPNQRIRTMGFQREENTDTSTNDQGGEGGEQQAAPRRGRPPSNGGARPAAAPARSSSSPADDETIRIDYGNKQVIPLPPGTALYDRLAALYKAHFG